MFKRLMCLLIPVLLLVSQATAFADAAIRLELNGRRLQTDSSPYIEDSRVFVPLRTLSEALGLTCDWTESTRTANIYGAVTLHFVPDSGLAYINGKKVVMASSIRNNRVMIPLRYIAECFGAEVAWSDATRCVSITAPDAPGQPWVDSYTEDEVFWLSRIIMAEAGGEPLEGQIAVGNVVLNRVKSSGFPNTIYTVIFDRAGGVQFEPVLNGTIYCTPSESAIEAAKRALSGENVAGASLFFLNPDKAQSLWMTRERSFFARIGHHDFYL